jgi:segregation and condensation protein A
MSEHAAEADEAQGAWEAPGPELAPAPGEALIIDVAGFEGPLDLLLALARTHKVDLAKISILALAEQYLTYIAEAEQLRIEIAADYLVMAAWLAYLKSRLILPREEAHEGEPSADQMAARLAFRLMRLEAMRKAVAELMTMKRLGRDVFGRGMPEGTRTIRDTEWTAEIYDLLKAYAEQRRRAVKITHVIKARKVWSIKEARQRLERLIGESVGDWVGLERFLDRYLPAAEESRTALASSFGASLEMAREGLLELRQDAPFAPIYVRRREGGADWQRLS